MDYSSFPQSINVEGSEDERYFYDDSESDLHETESTVVPSEDQTRARLADIAWPREGEDDTPPAVPRSSGRFTCTSVDEEAQLVTPSSGSVSVGFSVDQLASSVEQLASLENTESEKPTPPVEQLDPIQQT
uniref:Bifunctional protein GlmU n=1 Tax=Lygus hesperus TaxID=30085 RepID=A0A0A9WYV4_LYGHE